MSKSRILFTAVAVCALAGCATTGGSSSAASMSTYDDDIDYQKMAIITEDALSRGYKILWIHPPQKPKGRRGD